VMAVGFRSNRFCSLHTSGIKIAKVVEG
jgi:hypothetical protein